MLETGKLIASYDENYILFEGQSEKYYIGNNNQFGNLEIGNQISLNIIPTYYSLSYYLNNNGQYKLISIIESTKKSLYFILKIKIRMKLFKLF